MFQPKEGERRFIVSLEPMLQTAHDLGDAKYWALIAIIPPAPSKEGAAMRSDLIDNGVPVFKTMIRRSAGFQKAAFEGVPIWDISDSRARMAWCDYQALGKENMEMWQ